MRTIPTFFIAPGWIHGAGRALHVEAVVGDVERSFEVAPARLDQCGGMKRGQRVFFRVVSRPIMVPCRN